MSGDLGFDPAVPWPLVAAALVVGVPLLVLAAVRRRDGARALWLVRAGALLAAGALAVGPQVGSAPTTYLERPDVQVVVALDRTASMAVQDEESSSRLARAVQDVVEVSGATEASYALVTWGRDARTRVPFTTDTLAVARAARLVEPELPVAGVGSSTNRPLDELRRLVGQAAAEHPDRATYLLLMTDGEDTAPRDRRSYEPLAPFLDGGLVVGYGSDAGATVPLDPERPAEVVVDPATGAPAVSRRDADNLRRIAGQLDVGYVGRDEAGAAEELTDSLRPPRTEVAASHPQSVAWLCALLLLGFLLPDLRGICFGARELRDLGRAG